MRPIKIRNSHIVNILCNSSIQRTAIPPLKALAFVCPGPRLKSSVALQRWGEIISMSWKRSLGIAKKRLANWLWQGRWNKAEFLHRLFEFRFMIGGESCACECFFHFPDLLPPTRLRLGSKENAGCVVFGTVFTQEHD